MATLSSMFRNAGTDSTRSTVARRGTKLFSYILAVGFCPVLAIGPAMAGTNGTSSTRMHAPSVASGSRPAPVEPALTIRGLSLAEWTQRFWNRFMSYPSKCRSGH